MHYTCHIGIGGNLSNFGPTYPTKSLRTQTLYYIIVDFVLLHFMGSTMAVDEDSKKNYDNDYILVDAESKFT